MENTKRTIANTHASLELDLFGGAITGFHLKDNGINPLSFKFSSSEMPPNNRNGAPYQGHFLCLGRWGKPSKGEIRAGVPNHGQIANMLWEVTGESNDKAISMQVSSLLEGLHVERLIQLDPENPVYVVKEVVTNTNSLGRLYNMVQHPTLASPFLDEYTTINCNADIGFNNAFSQEPEKYALNWPHGICEDHSTINLSRPEKRYNSVFSFIVNKEHKYGWITAYSPKYRLILGYVWLRKDYPWINLWQDWSADEIRFRGIEFGTTGIHKPFHEILADNNAYAFGESTVRHIDAGEKTGRRYLSFLYKADPDLKAIDSVEVTGMDIMLIAKPANQKIAIGDLMKELA